MKRKKRKKENREGNEGRAEKEGNGDIMPVHDQEEGEVLSMELRTPDPFLDMYEDGLPLHEGNHEKNKSLHFYY